MAAQARHLHEPQRQVGHRRAAFWKIEPEETLLAHDELDLPPGAARLKFDGGHGGQNGLRDTMRLLGHGRFHRLRVGIGHPGHKDRVVGWVLGRPSKEDDVLIARAIDDAIDVLPLAVQGDFNEAMKRLHEIAGRYRPLVGNRPVGTDRWSVRNQPTGRYRPLVGMESTRPVGTDRWSVWSQPDR